MTLRIKLFGSLELEREGRPLARFASRKSGELFAYLALSRKSPHTREHLAGVFWGDSSEERARHTLNTTLWRINRVLEPPQCAAGERGYLRITPQHIGFNAASGVWLDVAEFESRCQLAEQSEAPTKFALYSQAVNLYRADLLADCYEDWCIVERERLQGLYVRALARLMAHNSSNAEYDLAIDCARRILTCDPLREEVHRDLMRLHLQAGQPAAALRQYRQCEDMLRDELGVEPAPETRALLTPILSSTSSPDASGPRRSPMTPIDLGVVAARVQDLADACDAAQAQLREAMALLREVTAELRPESRPVALARHTSNGVQVLDLEEESTGVAASGRGPRRVLASREDSTHVGTSTRGPRRVLAGGQGGPPPDLVNTTDVTARKPMFDPAGAQPSPVKLAAGGQR